MIRFTALASPLFYQSPPVYQFCHVFASYGQVTSEEDTHAQKNRGRDPQGNAELKAPWDNLNTPSPQPTFLLSPTEHAP